MPSIYDIKPKFQNLLRPTTKSLASAGITANQITIFALVFSIIAGALIYFFPVAKWPLLLVPVVLFIRMALNAIDGMLAREHNMKSNLGAILNELSDVISDSVLYLPLACLTGINAPLVVFAVLLAVLTEMTGVVAVQIGSERRYDGPMGKSDRAFIFGAIYFFLGISLLSTNIVNYLLMGIIAFLIVTIFNRAHRALKQAR
jgi:CDP-diacylglycerol--glycerol-3-phosphate 3-phosphatidyltransferase